MDYSASAEENNIVGGQIYGHPRGHLRGFHTLDYWGRPDEIGSPTTIFWQKAIKGASLANPNGVIYAVNALCPY